MFKRLHNNRRVLILLQYLVVRTRRNVLNNLQTRSHVLYVIQKTAEDEVFSH